MGISELAAEATTFDVLHRDLGAVFKAFLVDHPDRHRQRNSRPLMDEIREAFLAHQVLILPKELPTYDQDRPVYLVGANSPLAQVITMLEVDPNAMMANVLASLRFEGPQ
ncbi:hypothetical protein AB0B56_17570 [Streptosporangium canum]|uniref:hypothetical protein n=1 Tax=Streptosporangium canum TaxID=324952 RepID=UPI00342B4DD1